MIDGAADLSCASDELPSHIRDWSSHYHLSPTRANLLRGFDIAAGTRVLEVGAGCGAITRYLGETGCELTALEGSAARAAITASRCRDLANVRVVQDLFGQFSEPGAFDVVTLIGVLEYAPATFPGPDPVAACLRAALECLAPGGALVIAIENRLGLKYFNGCAEDHTGRPFDSLNDLYPDVAAHTWGARELAAHLARNGFARSEAWWPFPDYKLPRLLVHPRALDEPGLGLEYLVGQFPARDYGGGTLRVFDETLAWESVCRNGLLPDMANSFLLVAWRDGPPPPLLRGEWLAQIFSTDRAAAWRTGATADRGAAGNLRISRRRLYPQAGRPGPLRHVGEGEDGWISGVPYAHALHRVTFQPDAGARYREYLAGYLAAVRARAGSDGGARWDGALFDCIPVNLVRAPGGALEFIDREWIDTRGLEPGYLAFRAVVHDLARLHCLGGLQMFEGAATVGEFVRGALAAAGVSASAGDIARWTEAEGEAVDQVSLPGGPAFAGVLARRLAMAPGEAFLTVHGAAAPAAAPARAGGWRQWIARLAGGA